MYHPFDPRQLNPDEILMYLRKSRADDPALSVEDVLAKHESILEKWCQGNLSNSIPEYNRFREVVSGETIDGRPEIQKVLKLIESPRYKAILVVEIQRLSRGDLEDAGHLIKMLRFTKTMILTPTKIYDLQDEYDRDFFERELKRGNEFLEYQKKIMGRGRELSVRKGNFIGSIPPYGYDKAIVMEGREKCHTLTPNPLESPVVQLIFNMYAVQNVGCTTIAKHLNEMGIKSRKGTLWHTDSIKTILLNEHYIGKVRWNRRKSVNVVEDGEVKKTRPEKKEGDYLLCDGRHEPIISEELFFMAKEKHGKQYRVKSSTSIRNPLAGLLYCQCGRTMSLRTYFTKDGAERCTPRLICDNQAYCNTSSSTYDDVINKVRQSIEQNIRNFEFKLQNDDGNLHDIHEQLILQLKSKVKQLEQKEIAQWEAQADPDPANRMPSHIFKVLNEKLLKELDEARNALDSAISSIPERPDYEEKIERFKNALKAIDNDTLTAKKKNIILKSCIERITYHREKAERIKGKGALPNGIKSKEGRWSSSPITLDFKLRV